MSEHRNFWERLLKKTTKEVFEKDRAGKIIGKKTYQYDKQGGLVCCTDSSYDEAGKCFLKKKTKTYKRDVSGQYDSEQTIYYDDRERPITQKNYSRDASDLLYCDQIKYTYAKNGQALETERLRAYHNGGGLWTTVTKRECKYDDYDHLIQRKEWEHSGTKQGLICMKSKSFVRNSEGEYDPKETIYRDRQGFVTKSKVYERRQTELADTPLLFGKEKNFTYPNGEKKVESERELCYFMRDWLSMDVYQDLVKSAQKDKQDEIAKLEAKLAQLKGQVGSEKPKQTEPIKYVSGVKRDGR